MRIQNNAGKTPLEIAKEEKNKKAIALLEEALIKSKDATETNHSSVYMDAKEEDTDYSSKANGAQTVSKPSKGGLANRLTDTIFRESDRKTDELLAQLQRDYKWRHCVNMFAFPQAKTAPQK